MVTEQSRSRYAERYAAYRIETERRCRSAGVRYIPAVSDVDPLELLAEIARMGALIRPASGA